MRSMAAEGRTVFVSSHLMSEMALTADHLIVIGQGRRRQVFAAKTLVLAGLAVAVCEACAFCAAGIGQAVFLVAGAWRMSVDPD
jgi:ABC-type Na+ transport system ATPase subunit NatA